MAPGFLRTLLALPALPEPIRKSFRREQIAQLALPPAFALMEGGFVGVIADKTYHVAPWMLAVITAAPMFGNLTSFIWSWVANARRKVPILISLQAAVLICIGLMAGLPNDMTGALVLTMLVVASRLLMTGVTTVRSVVWSLNYGRELRARTAARLQILANVFTVSATLAAGFALDSDPDNFRYVYALGCLWGLIGVVAYSGVRVTRESRHRVLERRNQRTPDVLRPSGFFRILANDQMYARYQTFQFMSGFAAMMTIPALIFLVSRELGANYRVSFALLTIVPLTLSVLTMPLWGYLLDRMHVAEFRSRQSVLWVLDQLITFAGAMLGAVWIVGVARVINGVSNGGGNLAWELGHNDFAPRDQVAAYMSVHVTLTGVRGATAPFIGTAIYHGWSADWWLPAFAGLGPYLFLLSACLSTWSWFGFRRLARDMKPARDAMGQSSS